MSPPTSTARRAPRRRTARRTADSLTTLRQVVIALLLIAVVAGLVKSCQGSSTLIPESVRCEAPSGEPVATLDPEQAASAATIAGVAVRRRLPERAAVIAIATAMQESKLRNIEYGDRDSLGLLQQRPSQGWGTQAQVMDPVYAAEQFYTHLLRVKGWESMRLTVAAQRVQRSGFPEAYAQHETEAQALADALVGAKRASLGCVLGPAGTGTSPSAVISALKREIGVTAKATGRLLTVSTASDKGASAVSAWAVAHADEYDVTSVVVENRTWTRARAASALEWTSTTTPVGVRTIVITLAGPTTSSG